MVIRTLGVISGNPQLVATSGDAVRVCTQGRCIATVQTQASDGGAIAIGDPLTASAGGTLVIADASGDLVVARALQSAPLDLGSGNVSYIAVDVQREGFLS